MSARVRWVDIARGFGIVLVVFGHCWRGLHDARLIQSESLFYILDTSVYVFHMPLFFFLAGLFFHKSLTKLGATAFMWNKVLNVAYPYIVWSVLLVLVNSAVAPLVNKPQSLSALGSIAFKPVGPFWFLYALFLVQAVATLLVGVLRFPVKLLALAGAAALAASYFVDPSVTRQAMFQSAFFGFGALFAARVGLERRLPAWLGAFCLGVWGIGLVATLRHGFTFDAPVMLPLTLAGIFGMVAASQAASRSRAERWLRGFSVLGGASMAIYVSHTFFTGGTRIILLQVFGTQDVWVHLAVGVVAGSLGPIAMYFVLLRLQLARLMGLDLPPLSQPKPA